MKNRDIRGVVNPQPPDVIPPIRKRTRVVPSEGLASKTRTTKQRTIPDRNPFGPLSYFAMLANKYRCRES